MANPNHVEIVKQGAEAIAEWRKANPGERLDLRAADLRGAYLYEVDLRGADMRGANLRGTFLYQADMRGADLRWAEGHVQATGDGWEFHGIQHDNGLRIKGGACRWFTVAEAYARWSSGSKHDKISRAAVEALVLQAEARGWLIGDEKEIAA